MILSLIAYESSEETDDFVLRLVGFDWFRSIHSNGYLESLVESRVLGIDNLMIAIIDRDDPRHGAGSI